MGAALAAAGCGAARWESESDQKLAVDTFEARLQWKRRTKEQQNGIQMQMRIAVIHLLPLFWPPAFRSSDFLWRST